MTILRTLDSTDLSSRRSAARLRQAVERDLVAGHVALDLSAVHSVSESYADELLGVLVAEHGLAWVFERLELVGVAPAVAHTFSVAIRYRLLLNAEGHDTRRPLEDAREALRRRRVAHA